MQAEPSGHALQGETEGEVADVAGLVTDPAALLQVAAPVQLESFPVGERLAGCWATSWVMISSMPPLQCRHPKIIRQCLGSRPPS